MNFLDILLIIISSAGLLHGSAFAIYLFFFKKKASLTNYLLALILVFMAFRIGKSVVLHFSNNLEPLFIFIGLTFMLLIGPLLRWYTMGMTVVNFKFQRQYYFELTPFVLLFTSSLFVTENWFDTNSKSVIIIFVSVLFFVYLHFAFYIFLAGKHLQKIKKSLRKQEVTKSQSITMSWLKMVLIGFVVIWISYFLNIIDDTIPYLVGPIMYSIVVYFLSVKAFQLKTTESDGNVFKKNENAILFKQLVNNIINNELFLNPNLSLAELSNLIQKTPQKTSEIINQNAKQNFNDFVNSFRILKAKDLLVKHKNLTISSIAFDSGFNSLSSFNAAFKKNLGTTPSAYRKTIN
ncbi:AraC-type DNA-binding protein [Tenacibaculum sp. MAR_2009_124]|uniref:helix-turn-helix domain-containing protein n=1 Tax=Tenacibaculum sp. MAR_2009_124 TaxID=1250059 RepID=UPI000898D03B|nr:helix-turn-helix domain-containing protein [Tenacibaculum sp. MAR_2009_124]SEB47305.1 AraC-type DNA-binding protein [Tenacibaculum sp. MAR_2009_124]